MNTIINLPERDFSDLIRETARVMDIQPALVEKDIWVCVVLERLFRDTELKPHLIFKGGTSLSKVYKLIHRFSEDIDLIIDWKLFGYGEYKDDPLVPRKSRTQQDKFNKKLNEAAGEYIKDQIVPCMIELFSDIPEVEVLVKEADLPSVEVIYPQEAHRENNFPVRYSRHYYDTYQMCRSGVKSSALAQFDLLHDVVRFKSQFYPCSWARYDLAVPGTVRLIPSDKRLNQLEQDYQDMQVMLFKDIPTWQEIIHILKSLENEINSGEERNGR